MLKRFASLALIAASISACVSVQPARDVPIATTNAKTFIFDKTPAAGVDISRGQIVAALKQDIIRAAAHHPRCNPMCKTKKDGVPGYYFRGAIIESAANSFKVTYRRGDTYRTTTGDMSESYRDIIADLPYSITEQNDQWIVELSSPKSIHKTSGNDDWFLFKTDAEAIAQYNKLIAKLEPVVHVVNSAKGEFNVNYDPASVVTSLNRKLQPTLATRQDGGRYYTEYKLTNDKHSAIAAVNVYLNKGKSLVEYTIKHKFAADAKGNSSFDANVFNSFKQQLVDAANS